MDKSQHLGLRHKAKSLFRSGRSPARNAAVDVSKSTSAAQPGGVSHSLTTGNPSTTPGSAQSATTICARVEPGQRIFDAAIHALDEEDQATIRAIVIHEDIDAIKAVQDVVLAQKRKCEEKRWTMSVKGYTLGLGAVAGALSQLLDKIRPEINLISQVASAAKPGIGLAASVDPLHIGLPVALIRTVLGVVVFFQDQMERLLSGIMRVTFMLKQLSLYFEYFKLVESPAEAKSLEDVLANSYSLVYGFLAIGYRALSKRGPKRAWELLWSKSKVDEFVDSCVDAERRLEMAANHCHRGGTQKQLCEIKDCLDSVMVETKKLDLVRATVEALSAKIDLQRLRSARGAAYNVVDNRTEDTVYDYCLEGTRQKLIQEVTTWCHQSQQTVFWVSGMAGTGKSTVIRTVARDVEREGLLAASFFFRQDIADQRDATLFVQSIVAQLLTKYPLLRPHVATALDADLTLPGGPISTQFKKLLKEPLEAAGLLNLLNLVLIIDALDECSAPHAENILAQLAQLANQLKLRIIITSRPEHHLQTAFRKIKPDSVRLEEVKEGVEADIRLFLETKFNHLVTRDAEQRVPRLQPGWPGPATIDQLVQLTMPLFIFAATLFRYVSEYKPKDRLLKVLEESQSTSLSGIERVYLPILKHIYNGADNQQKGDFRSVVGSIVLLQNPLSAQALATLLDLPPAEIDEVLRPLHSVLRVPDDLGIPVRTLHKSFRDFLLDIDHEFRIDIMSTNSDLLDCCLKLMDGKLRKDLCEVVSPGTRRAGFNGTGDHIAPELEYSCLYWPSHVKGPIQDNDRVHHFLKCHLLHWLEALSWLGRLSKAIDDITFLQSCIKISEGAELTAFLEDARRFVLKNRHVVDLAPLQIYSSALIFSPKQSLVRQTFQQEALELLSLLPNVVSNLSAEILRLQGHDREVSSVAFSHDDKLLASASRDNTVRVWDAVTGEEKQKLEGHDNWVRSVAFSHDGKLLASASGDQTVRVWDAVTGEETQRLEGHDNWVYSVAFSRDGKLLASASGDQTVRVWDAVTGEETQRLEGHDNWVNSVAFSHDDRLLASASADRTIRVWDAVTGEEKQKLEGHDDWVHSVVFSHDGKLLASASSDQTVRVWDAVTGEETQKLEGHDGIIRSVAFSRDGKLLASASDDLTVRVWDAVTGEEMQKLEGHDKWIHSVAFSHDGKLLASASDDQTVRVWDAVTGQETQNLERHDDLIRSMAFSHDGRLLASACRNKMVRLWDAATGKEKQKLEGHDDWVRSVAFSHDDRLLASASDDQTVRVWDAVTGKEKQRLEGHDGWVHSVAFSHDDRLLASASRDLTVRVWDAATGEEKQKLDITRSVEKVEFSTDGKSLRTNVGTLNLGLATVSKGGDPEAFSELDLKEEWMRRRGEDMLWLPHEYRGQCWAAHANTFVVGQASGALSFLRIR